MVCAVEGELSNPIQWIEGKFQFKIPWKRQKKAGVYRGQNIVNKKKLRAIV